jgi:hypothetical protein
MRPQRSGKSNTPLDAKQRALIQQQELLRAKMERLQRLIDEAPRLAEQEEKKRREELVAQTARRSRRRDVPVLSDGRFELHAAVSAARPSRKTLKAEKRAARLKFFALALVLAGFLAWLRHIIPILF